VVSENHFPSNKHFPPKKKSFARFYNKIKKLFTTKKIVIFLVKEQHRSIYKNHIKNNLNL